MNTLTAARGLLIALCATLMGTSTSRADVVLTYIVEFAQSGNVVQGSNLDWTLSVEITESDVTNFGIRRLDVNLNNNTGETMNPATIHPDFANYTTSPGAPGIGAINFISAALIPYDAVDVLGEVGDLGPFTLATGSYQVNTLGLHILSADTGGFNRYYTAPGLANADYDNVLQISDSVNVVAAVPEPASMMLASTFLCPALVIARRRRRRRDA